MGLSLQPGRLKRYSEIARLLFKYGRADLVTRAGLYEALRPGDATPSPGAPNPDELAADLERMGLAPEFDVNGALRDEAAAHAQEPVCIQRVCRSAQGQGIRRAPARTGEQVLAGGVWLAVIILTRDRPARGGW